MTAAYLFTFFVFVLLILFVLLPFLQRGKSTSVDIPETAIPAKDDYPEEQLLLIDNDTASSGALDDLSRSLERDIEIEVAVARVRHRKSTFWKCMQCGRRMGEADLFCASCGKAR